MQMPCSLYIILLYKQVYMKDVKIRLTMAMHLTETDISTYRFGGLRNEDE